VIIAQIFSMFEEAENFPPLIMEFGLLGIFR